MTIKLFWILILHELAFMSNQLHLVCSSSAFFSISYHYRNIKDFFLIMELYCFLKIYRNIHQILDLANK